MLIDLQGSDLRVQRRGRQAELGGCTRRPGHAAAGVRQYRLNEGFLLRRRPSEEWSAGRGRRRRGPREPTRIDREGFRVQQFFTPYPDSHYDTLRLHGASVQGEVSFSRCISSYCTTVWRLPPLLYLSIIVTFIDMNNRAARLRILHAARPLTLCINGVYISAALEIIDTTT